MLKAFRHLRLPVNFNKESVQMDRTVNTANNIALITVPSLPMELYNSVLQQVNSADKPILFSLSRVSRQLHELAMPFLMECYISTTESAFSAMQPVKRFATVMQMQKWLVDNADRLPLLKAMNTWDRLHKLVPLAIDHARYLPISEFDDQLQSELEMNASRLSAVVNPSRGELVAIQKQISLLEAMAERLSGYTARWMGADDMTLRMLG
jgi:hypothetical protein